jgi:hypothetical protein
MLATIDPYLRLPPGEKANYRLGRRAGIYRSVDNLSNPELRDQVDRALKRIELEHPGAVDQVISELMESFI